MSVRSAILLDAKLIMRDGLCRVHPDATLDERGYVDDWRANLLPGVDPVLVEADLGAGKGNELDRKFRAAHSSAALAVNAFGPFRDGRVAVPLPGVGAAHAGTLLGRERRRWCRGAEGAYHLGSD